MGILIMGSVGPFANSEEAQKYRKKAWEEILTILEEKYPEAHKLAAAQS